MRQRLRRLVPALWAGVLLCIAFIATPAPFAALPAAEAGRVVARIFAQEAYLSLVLCMVLFFIERSVSRDDALMGAGSVLSTNVVLVLGALFCTVMGYFALQPMMAAARAGQGAWSFGALHGASLMLFALKGILVLTLAVRVTRQTQNTPRG